METQKSVKIEVADPTALGLFGLAMVTLVASSQKLGLTEGLSFLVPWAFLLGGVIQVIASVFDFLHKNLFGAIAFSAYGFFWISVAACWLIKMGCFGPELAAGADVKQLGVAFLGYLIFSIFVTIVAFKLNTLLSILMLVIDVLLFALMLDAWGCGAIWKSVGGYSELMVALLSFYACGAAFLNNAYGRVMLPTGKAWLK